MVSHVFGISCSQPRFRKEAAVDHSRVSKDRRSILAVCPVLPLVVHEFFCEEVGIFVDKLIPLGIM